MARQRRALVDEARVGEGPADQAGGHEDVQDELRQCMGRAGLGKGFDKGLRQRASTEGSTRRPRREGFDKKLRPGVSTNDSRNRGRRRCTWLGNGVRERCRHGIRATCRRRRFKLRYYFYLHTTIVLLLLPTSTTSEATTTTSTTTTTTTAPTTSTPTATSTTATTTTSRR